MAVELKDNMDLKKCPDHCHDLPALQGRAVTITEKAVSYISPWIPQSVKSKGESLKDYGSSIWSFEYKEKAVAYISPWIPLSMKSKWESLKDYGSIIRSFEYKENKKDVDGRLFERIIRGNIVLHIPPYFIAKEELMKTMRNCLKLMESLEAENEFLNARFYRVDVVFNPETAHPKLEVSEDRKCVWNRRFVSKVTNSEKNFDSHSFILAAEGFSKGKHYWEVTVDQKKTWDLGVASESACRKGKITLSPENGYWVIGHDGGKDYWARTDPWTHQTLNRRARKIGIFLNMPDKILSFYDVHTKSKLYTFPIPCPGKLYPFFSTGSVPGEQDDQPLKISSWFEEDEKQERSQTSMSSAI